METNKIIVLAGCILLASAFGVAGQESAEKEYDSRIQAMEETLNRVLVELESLKKDREAWKKQAEAESDRSDSLEQNQQALMEELEEMRESGTTVETQPQSSRGPIPGNMQSVSGAPRVGSIRTGGLPPGLQLGGYGEHHFNLKEGDGDGSDIHRFVTFVGYEFADWARLNSEVELEHAFVNDGDGEISIEQFFVDVDIIDEFNIRVGRVLHPAGIINRFHEPTTFLGVERPSFSKNILPSTWSIDGVGFRGNLTDWLSYEAYVHAGLDGSKFSGSSGIRGGRIKERPGFNDVGFSGRVDFYPLVAFDVPSPVALKTGFSYSNIGTDNSDQDKGTGRPDSNIQVFSYDMDLRWKRLDLRGEIAFIDNPAAEDPGVGAGTSDEIFGTYFQAGYHFMPDAWKTGKLEQSDAVGFVRYEYYDTQFGDVTFGTKDRSKSRRDLVFGLAFHPMPRLVFKADLILSDTLDGNAPNRYDFGFGYSF